MALPITIDECYVSVVHRAFRRAVQEVLDGDKQDVPRDLVDLVMAMIEEQALIQDGRLIPISIRTKEQVLETWMWAVSRVPRALC